MSDDEATARYFKEHSVARLIPLIRLAAVNIAYGDDYSCAFSGVMRDALRLGAWQLSPQWADTFNQWLHRALSQEIERIQPAVDRSASDLVAEHDADPISYYEKLASPCSDPDAMRWTFAAISKPYRDYLNAVADDAGSSIRARRDRIASRRSAIRARRAELYAG